MNTEKSRHTADSISSLELRNLLLQAFLPPPTQGRGGNQFPNVSVTSHAGRTYQFHSNLIANKVVMLQFMSLDNQQHFASLNHMAQIADRLGDKLGKDVNIYSITTKPEADSIDRLAAYAEEHNLPAGWLLLRPTAGGSQAISDRFAKHLTRHHHHTAINSRMVHYGNGGVGIWGAFAVDADPDMALSRVSWLQPGKIAGYEMKRAGPIALTRPEKDINSNRDV